MKRHLLIALAMLILVVQGLVLSAGCPAPSFDSGTGAAIVDQLAILETKQAFIEQMTAELEACGFETDVYRGE